MHGLILSLILGVVLFIIGNLFLEDIFSVFGAEGNVLVLAMGYMKIVLYGIFFMFPMFVIHNIFTAQGDTKTPVIMQAIALSINIILDPIFIYVLGFGVRGAAIATTITFAFGLLLGIYLIIRKSELRIAWKSFKYNPKIMKEIFTVGMPASLMMIIMSVYVVFLNRFMAHYSTEHVAAFGLVTRLESFAGMTIMAFSLSLMTLAGMFYGAKEYEKLKSTVWYGIRTSALVTSCVGLFFLIFPELFLWIFTDDPEVLRVGVIYMRINVFTFPLMAGGMSAARVLQGLGKGLPGLILTFTRIVFVAVPLAWVFVFVLDLSFIWVGFAMILGGIAANIVGLPWLYFTLKKLK